jgi:hypothetical protein
MIAGLKMMLNSEHDIMIETDTLDFDTIIAEWLNDIPNLSPIENRPPQPKPMHSPHKWLLPDAAIAASTHLDRIQLEERPGILGVCFQEPSSLQQKEWTICVAVSFSFSLKSANALLSSQ